MIKLLFLIYFSSSINLSYGFEDYPVWPDTITKESILYRGQSTAYNSFDHLIDMLVRKDSEQVITSRLFFTLRKVYPNKNNKQLVDMVNRQITHYKNQKILGQVTYCHAGVYDCEMLSVEELQGVIFPDSKLPVTFVKIKERQNSGGRFYESVHEAEEVLSFFDPIVSTSWNRNIALQFAKDKDEHIGLVLYLQDINNCNCSPERKAKAKCFINHSEYLDELEFPFYGYATAEELFGFEVKEVLINKKENKLIISKLGSKESYRLINCSKKYKKKISKVFSLNKKLTKALVKNKLGCLQKL